MSSLRPASMGSLMPQTSITSAFRTLEVGGNDDTSSITGISRKKEKEEDKQQPRKKQKLQYKEASPRNVDLIRNGVKTGLSSPQKIKFHNPERYEALSGFLTKDEAPFASGKNGGITRAAHAMVLAPSVKRPAVVKRSSPRKEKNMGDRISLRKTTVNEIEIIDYLQKCLKRDAARLLKIESVLSKFLLHRIGKIGLLQIVSEYTGYQSDDYFPNVDVIMILVRPILSKNTEMPKDRLESARIRMQHCGSDAFGIIQERDIPLKELSAISRKWASGLYYLHQQGIAHRDIKPENLFLDGSIARIGDFGEAARFTPGSLFTTVKGTLRSLPPEALLDLGYNEKTDVWAFGIVLAMSILREEVFMSDSEEFLLHTIQERLKTDLGEIFSGFPKFMHEDCIRFFTQTPAGLRLKSINWEPIYKEVFQNKGYFIAAGQWYDTDRKPIDLMALVIQKREIRDSVNLSLKARLSNKIDDSNPLKDAVIDLCLKCLTVDPIKRPSMEDILYHPFHSTDPKDLISRRCITPISVTRLAGRILRESPKGSGFSRLLSQSSESSSTSSFTSSPGTETVRKVLRESPRARAPFRTLFSPSTSSTIVTSLRLQPEPIMVRRMDSSSPISLASSLGPFQASGSLINTGSPTLSPVNGSARKVLRESPKSKVLSQKFSPSVEAPMASSIRSLPEPIMARRIDSSSSRVLASSLAPFQPSRSLINTGSPTLSPVNGATRKVLRESPKSKALSLKFSQQVEASMISPRIPLPEPIMARRMNSASPRSLTSSRSIIQSAQVPSTARPISPLLKSVGVRRVHSGSPKASISSRASFSSTGK